MVEAGGRGMVAVENRNMHLCGSDGWVVVQWSEGFSYDPRPCNLMLLHRFMSVWEWLTGWASGTLQDSVWCVYEWVNAKPVVEEWLWVVNNDNGYIKSRTFTIYHYNIIQKRDTSYPARCCLSCNAAKLKKDLSRKWLSHRSPTKENPSPFL